MNQSLGTIKVHCGRLVVAGYNSCEIMNEDGDFNYSGPNTSEIPELKFGLITYRCDKEVGYLISPFDCKRCNFSCEGKIFDDGCPQGQQLIWSAAILAMLFIMLVGSFLCKSFIKGLCSPYSSSGCYQVRYTQKSEHSDDNIAISPNQNDEEADDADWSKPKSQKDADDAETQSSSNRGNVPHPTSKKKKLGALAAGLVLNDTASACNWTVLLNSNKMEMICNATLCHNTTSNQLPLLLGQDICFEDHLSNVFVSIKITDIILRSRYEFMFHTFDYNTNTTVLSSKCSKQKRGKGGGCSKLNRDCDPDNIDKLNKQALKTDRLVQGWSCDDSNQDNNLMCCHFFWQIEMTEAFPVLRKTGYIWIVKFTLSQNDGSQQKTVEVNALDPAFNIFGYGPNSGDRLLVTVLNVTKEMGRSTDYLLIYDGKIYSVNTSEINTPPPDSNVLTVEDLANAAKAPSGICSNPAGENNCECNCNYFLDSKISEFKTKLNDLHVEDEFFIRKNDSSIIDTFQRLYDFPITVKLDDQDSQLSTLVNGKCDVDHVLTHGCTSCEKGSYLVFVSRNVEEEGPVPFQSNCSFNKNYINCDKFEPTKLIFKERYQTCVLEMLTLNKTFLLNIEYLNMRFQVDPLKNLNSAGAFSRSLECFIKNESFMKSFFASLSLLSLCVVIVAVVFRCFYACSHPSNAEN